MNISKISSNNTMITSAKPNSVVNDLQKQKMELTKQIESIKAGDSDAKAKTEKIKEINEQIAEINKQIMEAQLEERKKQVEESQQKAAEKAEIEKVQKADDTQKDGVALSSSLYNLLSSDTSYSQYETLKGVRARIPYGERNGSKMMQVESDMAKKFSEVNNSVEKSVNLGIIAAKQARTDKNDDTKEKMSKENEEVSNTSNGQVEHNQVNVNTDINTNNSTENDKTTVEEIKNPKIIDILV